ncbi:MAG: hypothetical protein LC126_05735 [Bryobacterales bacterium]|nr:hypothetical protein [Bryobacterales bacterium]
MLVEDVDRVTFAAATTPSPITVVLMPKIIQITWPLDGLQEMLFPAFMATAPAATVTALKSVALYVRVNCRLAGWDPEEVPERERFKGIVSPG